jgi:16S rRNA G966 N2-methylase RsmD
MKCLTIQDIEWRVTRQKKEDTCPTKRHIKRQMKHIITLFNDFILSNCSSREEFDECFKLQSKANKSSVNSSRYLKEEFYKALYASGGVSECGSGGSGSGSSVSECGSSGDSGVSECGSDSGMSSLQQEADGARARAGNIIRLSLIENKLSVSISLAGEMELYKRTYKTIGGTATAPLPEHQASACIQWALHTIYDRFNDEEKARMSINNIIVPFAGTGTLGFESLLTLWGPTGSGLFTARSFPFDDFPIVRATTNGGMKSYGNDGKLKLSDMIREEMRKEIAHKVSGIRTDITCDSYFPQLCSGARVLFSDINDDALKTCGDNIASFIQSSGNVFTERMFMKPQCIDFLNEDIDMSKVLCHTVMSPHGGANEESVSKSEYSKGTTFILLNPPFGLRLAKNSSTLSMYTRLATQVICMRDELLTLKTLVPSELLSPTPSLVGLCLCPDVKTWSTFITSLTANQFECETTHFSLGGNDMRLVCFWDKGQGGVATSIVD